MRVNVYSQEFDLSGFPELFTQKANTGIIYSAVRFVLHSSPKLHHPPEDDDRSAVAFWLPKSSKNREKMAQQFELAARQIREAPLETGLD